MAKKADLLAQAEGLGLDVDDSWTVAQLEDAIREEGAEPTGVTVDPERVCPNCGELHASSIVTEAEINQLEGLKLSALPQSDTYRVFYCKERFFAVPHQEGGS